MSRRSALTYDPMKRGDTPVFSFTMTSPSDDFDWSSVVADFAMTDVAAPSNNSGAAVVRTSQALTVDGSNNASFTAQPTVAESNALSAGTTYNVEVQLREGITNVATISTGTIVVVQDYII